MTKPKEPVLRDRRSTLEMACRLRIWVCAYVAESALGSYYRDGMLLSTLGGLVLRARRELWRWLLARTHSRLLTLA